MQVTLSPIYSLAHHSDSKKEIPPLMKLALTILGEKEVRDESFASSFAITAIRDLLHFRSTCKVFYQCINYSSLKFRFGDSLLEEANEQAEKVKIREARFSWYAQKNYHLLTTHELRMIKGHENTQKDLHLLHHLKKSLQPKEI